MTQFILGSQSPRRKEILGYFLLPFEVAHPPFDEESLSFYDPPIEGNPEKYVCALSKAKADSLQHTFPNAVILTADTIVFREGIIYGKPKNEETAFLYLSELAGKWHTVYTGVTVRKGAEEYHLAEATQVLFNPLTPAQIRHYHSQTNWSDKAGGYAIQASGGIIVRKIEGCYYNVMGLPLNSVQNLLSKIGIELWNYLK